MILAGKMVILKGFGANFLAMQVQPMPRSCHLLMTGRMYSLLAVMHQVPIWLVLFLATIHFI
jgi:hypothetical protein